MIGRAIDVEAGYAAVYDLIRTLPPNPYDPSYNDAVRNGYIWHGVEAFRKAAIGDIDG